MLWLFCPLLGFFLGSLPFGLFVARASSDIDPRTEGSRNTGATNVARLCGTKFGVLVLVLDILKGLLPVLIAQALSDNWLLISTTALGAVLGHVFSPLLGFKGGKAVATAIGVFVGVAPLATILSAASCIAVIAASGYVSMGSLTLALGLPVFALITGKTIYIPLACVIAVILFWRHRENIKRLSRGEENPWRKKKRQ